jgi:hypothetical protein
MKEEGGGMKEKVAVRAFLFALEIAQPFMAGKITNQ